MSQGLQVAVVFATSRALYITVGYVSSVSVTSMPVEVKDEPEKRRDSTKEVWKLSRSCIEPVLISDGRSSDHPNNVRCPC